MTLILWDIDGTLVRGKGGRVSSTAFMQALKVVGNLAEELSYPGDAHGKTDAQIALEVLAAAQIADGEATALLASFSQAYLAALEGQRERLLGDLEVLPGVPRVLARLKALGVTQSLLTGNLQPVARLKLDLAGLDQYVDFDIGAFGSDHPDRSCLVPIARERARQRLGSEMRPEDVVVVGDTPRDIACARAGGAHVVGVATGYFKREELEAYAPDAVLDDLSDTEAVVRTLLRYSTNSEAQSALIV
jgi:phosphoglycolate phosphatase